MRRIFLSSFESYYYLFLNNDLKFKRLFVKFAKIKKRVKAYYPVINTIYNSCDDLIIDVTPYDIKDDLDGYSYQVEALMNNINCTFVSRNEELDIPFSDVASQNLRITNQYNVLSRNVLIQTSKLNIPRDYYNVYGVLYGGATFHKNVVLKHSYGTLIKCGERSPEISKTEQLKANLIQIREYFDFLEAL